MCACMHVWKKEKREERGNESSKCDENLGIYQDVCDTSKHETFRVHPEEDMNM